jgi:nitrous oxidase accessory protein NosD
MLRCFPSLGLAVFGLVAFSMSNSAPASAAVHVVDDDGMASAADCDAAVPTFSTISAAEAASSAGDTIKVCPGLYNEQVSIDVDDLTLVGAQAGIDARTRATAPAAESVIDHSCGPVQIRADRVTLDGFTVQGSTDPDPCFLAGIWTNPGATGSDGGHRILNNIVQNNISGIELDSTCANATLVRFNLIRNNNNAGPGSGNAIQTNFGLCNATIDSNKFSGHTNASFLVVAASSDLTVSNNELVGGTPERIVFASVTTSSIVNNVSDGSTSSGTVRLFCGNSSISIDDNVLINGVRGIRVDDPFAIGANSGVTAHHNCIHGNSTAGLEVESGGHSGTLNAENNWWGDSSGPSGTGPGTGDAIVDPDGVVDFDPWLITDTGAPCPPAPGFHDANLYKWDDGGSNIGLGSTGMKVQDAELVCQNKSDHPKHPDLIRCLVEVSGLPAGCSVRNSGPDKIFGTGDDGPTVTGPGGGILQDDTRVYPTKGYKKSFKFKEKWQCTPPLTTQKFNVVTKGIADHNADDYPAADDDDDNPSNNVKTRPHVLKK